MSEEKVVEPLAAPNIEVQIGLVRAQLSVILTAAGGLESNITYPSTYWFLQNKLKSLLRQL